MFFDFFVQHCKKPDYDRPGTQNVVVPEAAKINFYDRCDVLFLTLLAAQLPALGMVSRVAYLPHTPQVKDCTGLH